MQVLLSRAATARASCRCFSCGRSTKTVTRRNVNAPKRRRIGANDVFTACYSSLMASAVIADAEVKKNRRKRWDQAIEDAKSGISRTEADNSELEHGETTYSPISAPSASTVDTAGQCIPSWRADSINAGDLSRAPFVQTQRKLESWGQRLQQSLDVGQQIEEVEDRDQITKIVDQEDVTTEQDGDVEAVEWADERPIPGIPLRTYVNKVHVDKAEEAVRKLAKNILQHISIIDRPRQLSPVDDHYKVEIVLDAISKLFTGFCSYPSYKFQHEDIYSQTRKHLHKSFYKICQNTTEKRTDIDCMLAKICYNLLVAPIPPSTITYNILLGELHRIKQHDVAEVVIQTFLNDTRLAPTFETMQLMLDHYVERGDYDAFQFMRNRMRGVAQGLDGQKEVIHDMRLGRRKVRDLYQPHVQQWARQQKIVVRDGTLIRRSPRDQGVFNSLIKGSLAFSNTRQAIRIFGDAAGHVKVQSEWICDIASRCLALSAHRGARRFFRYLIKYWRSIDSQIIVTLSKDVRLAVQQVLALIGVDMSDLTTLFPKLPFMGIYEQDAHAMMLDMHLETAKEQIESLDKAISLFTSAVLSESPDNASQLLQAYDEQMLEYDDARDRPCQVLRKAQISCVQERVMHSVKRSVELQRDGIELLEQLGLSTQRSLGRRTEQVQSRSTVPAAPAVWIRKVKYPPQKGDIILQSRRLELGGVTVEPEAMREALEDIQAAPSPQQQPVKEDVVVVPGRPRHVREFHEKLNKTERTQGEERVNRAEDMHYLVPYDDYLAPSQQMAIAAM